MSDPENRNLIIVTGLSGAGMSSTLKDLEDMGYEAFDNFPLSLLEALINDPLSAGHPVAVGIDSRSRGLDSQILLGMIRELGAKLLYITADEAVLQKRFTETRRRHPLAKDRPVAAGIKREQEILHELKAAADVVIDTTDLSIHDLKKLLKHHFGIGDDRRRLTVTLMSFGFRFGLPREADIVMDVRFLKNPYWVPEIRSKTGIDPEVGAYIETDENFIPFLERLKTLIGPQFPLYATEGKSYLTIAIGCTGGHHRSVYTVERLKSWIETQDVTAHILHRDISR